MHINDKRKNLFLLGWLFGLLWQQNRLNVGENTTLSNGNTRQKFVQLLVVSDSQLQVSWDNSGLLVITGSIASQLENFSAQVLENGSPSNSLCIRPTGNCKPALDDRVLALVRTLPPFPRTDILSYLIRS